MFSIYHFIWLFICAILVFGSLHFLHKYRPSLKSVLSVCCIICAVSETVKLFSMIQLVPTADGSMYYPYVELQHLPFHLCSVQIIFIFYARFAKDSKVKDRILGFMYATCIVGALFALALPSIFNTTIKANQAFTHPIAYELFIYHSMLIVMGSYIYTCKKDTFDVSYYFTTEMILVGMALLSMYVNSLCSVPVYENGKLIAVEHTTNFFFTFLTPIGLKLTAKWQWGVYILIILGLAITTVGAAYIPVFRKCAKAKKVSADVNK